MSTWAMPPVAGFVDTGVAPEFYVDSIGGIETANGNVRVHLVSTQARLEIGETPSHKLVTVKLVGPLLNIPQIIGQLALCCVWQQPSRDRVRGQAPHLVP